ncbi:MAG: hypothetical protein CR975_04180 [Gammaproteobacteria bacterium]|nr:MAG: hypothetical protein CR975_04180 [Gammaproteobacteria bacterium]
MLSAKKEKFMRVWINTLLFLSITVFLVSRSSYAIPLSLLAITALIYYFYDLVFAQRFEVSVASCRQDYGKMIIGFLLFFGISVFFYIYHQESASFLDKPSRLIAFSLVLLLLLRYPPQTDVLLIAINLAAIVAGCVAIYQVYYLSIGRAFYKMLAIQGGDIAMSLGLFSVFIGSYALYAKKRIILLFSLLGSVLGIFASFLSASRGGWLCLPLLALMLLCFYRKKITAKGTLIALLTGAVVAGFFVTNPKLPKRVYQAYHEVQMYYGGAAKNTSVGRRLELWKSAVYAWQEKPVLGWGKKGIKTARQAQEKDKRVIANLHKTKLHTHNQFLEELSVRGMVGFIIFILFLAIPLWVFAKYRHHEKADVRLISHLGMLHVFLVVTYCLTQNFFAHNSGMMFYALMIVVFYSALAGAVHTESGVDSVFAGQGMIR